MHSSSLGPVGVSSRLVMPDCGLLHRKRIGALDIICFLSRLNNSPEPVCPSRLHELVVKFPW